MSDELRKLLQRLKHDDSDIVILSVISLIVIIIIILALVLHSQGLKISKSKNVCLEWLRWGLGNSEHVGKAHCVETLNCH